MRPISFIIWIASMVALTVAALFFCRLYFGGTHEDLIYIGCDECIGELHERVDSFGPLQVSSGQAFKCSTLWALNVKWGIPMGKMRVDLRPREGCMLREADEAAKVGE